MKIGKPLADLRWIVVLAATTGIVHFLALRFVFPGYYDPFWPHHSDFYIPAAMAHAHPTLAQLLRAPRPIGQIFMLLIGHLGVRGSIAAVVAVAMLDCIGSALIVQRLLGEEPSSPLLAGFATYVFMVFVQPHFYVFYTHDALSHASYLLLLAAAPVAWRYMQASSALDLVLFGALALLAFLTKETYAIPALFLACVNALWSVRRSRGARGFSLLAVLAAVLLLALAIERSIGSPFTGGASAGGPAYAIALQPVPLALEWVKYARETFAPLSVGMILLPAVVAAILFSVHSRQFAIAAVLPLAGALSWLANSALPNHHFAGYTSSAAYLLYAPLLLLPTFVRRSRIGSAAAATIVILALASPVLARSKYALDSWSLQQEARQRNLLESIEHLASQVGADSRRVLVTGIDFPFSPFDHGDVLRAWPALGPIHFDVMTYADSASAAGGKQWRGGNVWFVPRSQVRPSDYDAIWAYRSDGTLARVAWPHRPTPLSAGSEPLADEQFLIFPDLQDVLEGEGLHEPASVKDLRCGSVLLQYGALDEAQACLQRALSMSPASPYAYFYLGVISERRGELAKARAYFADAIRFDSHASPNPGFREALARVEADRP